VILHKAISKILLAFSLATIRIIKGVIVALAGIFRPGYKRGGASFVLRLPECLDKRPLNREFRGKLRRDPFPVLEHKLGVILGGMQRPAGVIKFVFVVKIGQIKPFAKNCRRCTGDMCPRRRPERLLMNSFLSPCGAV
jgi:hypothetical protein